MNFVTIAISVASFLFPSIEEYFCTLCSFIIVGNSFDIFTVDRYDQDSIRFFGFVSIVFVM